MRPCRTHMEGGHAEHIWKVVMGGQVLGSAMIIMEPLPAEHTKDGGVPGPAASRDHKEKVVLAAKAVEHTRQRRWLRREGQWNTQGKGGVFAAKGSGTYKAKAVSYQARRWAGTGSPNGAPCGSPIDSFGPEACSSRRGRMGGGESAKGVTQL